MDKSTASAPRRKPAKPYEGFPLFAHPSGQWAKKIKPGPLAKPKLFYFGVWADPEAALARLNREWPYLKEGKTPAAIDVLGGCTLRILVSAFLGSKEAKLDADDLSPRTFRDYYKTCDSLIEFFGKDRRVDEETGKPEEVTFTPNPVIRGMVFLGLNCGFGNTDIALLPQMAVNLETGWIVFPRPKTEIPRRCPLWPKTVAALRAAIANRPAPFDASARGLCFLTRQGRPKKTAVPSRTSRR